MSDTAAMTADAGALLRAIAPHELPPGVPLYVIAKQDVPAELGGDAAADGWTSPTLDLQLKPVIGGGWEGRGVAVVASGRDRRSFAAVAVHELAHALDRPRLYFDPPALVTLPELAEHSGRELAEPMPPGRAVASHPPGWCRLAVHLACRAGEARGGPPLADVLGYPHLRPFAFTMLKALGGEVATFLDQPVTAVARLPLPQKFLALWHESADWCRELEARTNPTTPTETTR